MSWHILMWHISLSLSVSLSRALSLFLFCFLSLCFSLPLSRSLNRVEWIPTCKCASHVSHATESCLLPKIPHDFRKQDLEMFGFCPYCGIHSSLVQIMSLCYFEWLLRYNFIVCFISLHRMLNPQSNCSSVCICVLCIFVCDVYSLCLIHVYSLCLIQPGHIEFYLDKMPVESTHLAVCVYV